MDIIAFLKSLLLDSLGGIPLRLIPFLIVQLILSVVISLVFGKIFEIESTGLRKLVFSGVAMLALSITASISVSISILFAVLVIMWILKFKDLSPIDRIVFVMVQFLFGSGYVMLGVITMIILGLYFLLTQKKS